MKVRDLRGRVDLETPDKDLEDLIIKEYKGLLKEEQHQIIKDEEGNKKYCFYELSIVYLLKVLNKYRRDYTYIVKKSSDKRVIMWQVKAPFFYVN